MSETYRNFIIRAEQLVRVPESTRGMWRGFMRELPDGKEKEICVLGKDEPDAMKIARQCVDYQYRVEVWEFLNGRKYSPMKDGCIEAFDK